MINPNTPRRIKAVERIEALGYKVRLEGLGFIMPAIYIIYYPDHNVLHPHCDCIKKVRDLENWRPALIAREDYRERVEDKDG